jgi:hypothetical protein
MTDYRSLSGAEFQRAVGTDPDKWAEAFRQREMPNIDIDTAEIARWFADAMEAARAGSIREVIKGDGA